VNKEIMATKNYVQKRFDCLTDNATTLLLARTLIMYFRLDILTIYSFTNNLLVGLQKLEPEHQFISLINNICETD
jgi:hypothetical protein